MDLCAIHRLYIRYHIEKHMHSDRIDNSNRTSACVHRKVTSKPYKPCARKLQSKEEIGNTKGAHSRRRGSHKKGHNSCELRPRDCVVCSGGGSLFGSGQLSRCVLALGLSLRCCFFCCAFDHLLGPREFFRPLLIRGFLRPFVIAPSAFQ